MALITNLYSALAQGTLWGIMALGVYITFRILDIADLSCDGTFAASGLHPAERIIKSAYAESRAVCFGGRTFIPGLSADRTAGKASAL